MVSQITADLLGRNSRYTPSHQPWPLYNDLIKSAEPGQGVLIISCADPRIIPENIFRLNNPEEPNTAGRRFFVIRNAGGRVTSEMGSIAVFHTLKIGPLGAIVVIHHTDCGATHITENDIRTTLLEFAPEHKSEIYATGHGVIDPHDIDGSIREDVAFLRNSPLVKKDIEIIGLKYDLATGVLTQIE